MDEFINKLMLPGVNGEITMAADPEFQKAYPVLWAFLTVQFVTNVQGERVPRRTASVSVYCGPAGPQAFLNDRATNRCLCVSSPTFGGLWAALERALTTDPVLWRYQDQWVPEKKSTSRKKGS